jgi:hypothetical protein
MTDPDQLARIESVRRLAREKQDQLAKCGDPQRRVVLLRERNELLAKLKRLRRASFGKS